MSVATANLSLKSVLAASCTGFVLLIALDVNAAASSAEAKVVSEITIETRNLQ